MSHESVRHHVLEALRSVAPEVDPDMIDPTKALSEQTEMDSVDFLSFLRALTERFDGEIPEADYSKLTTLDGCITYFAGRELLTAPHDGLASSARVLDRGAEYARACLEFSWDSARRELTQRPGIGGTNLAFEALTGHAIGALGERTAIRFIDREGTHHSVTFRRLDERSNRVANALATLGVKSQDHVFSLLGRGVEIHEVALGVLKLGAVFSPLFPALGPEPVQLRLAEGAAHVLITTSALYQAKVKPIRPNLRGLEHVVLVGDDALAHEDFRTHAYHRLLDEADPGFSIEAVLPDHPAVLHFTSGTSGPPRGVFAPHDVGVVLNVTARQVLELRPGDVYWCTADPGWVTGTNYGILAPLLVGATNLVTEASFDPRGWVELLRQESVAVWYTTPTALRMLMRSRHELSSGPRFDGLRLIATVGEPLGVDVADFAESTFGCPVRDTWWQTETGAIVIAQDPRVPPRRGSLGVAIPGVEAIVGKRSGDRVEECRAEEEGLLVLGRSLPSLFRGYLREAPGTQECFAGDWYVSQDIARRDADGYFWFVGREDDIIKSSGHLIGPFEVESTLLGHPAVADVGVVGIPDAVAGSVVKAFVELKPRHAADEATRREILGFARQRLGPVVAPRDIAFLSELPRNRSGKLLRRLLRARALGLTEAASAFASASEPVDGEVGGGSRTLVPEDLG